jgi:flagellar biogenesis protein FliO
LVALLVLFAAVSVSFAAAPKAAISPKAALSPEDALEASPVYVTHPGSASAKSNVPASPASGFDLPRVVLALGGVIALIFILRAVAKRVIPGAAAHRGSSSVKVLSRCPISNRQNLLVVQFGKRLVLVGDAGSNLNPLCEIADPDEVAAILAHARDESISVARRFESLFGRAQKDFEDVPQSESDRADSFDSSRDIPAQDPLLNDTQKELTDLQEKVRNVARQIGRA